ncbi:MAG: holo-ACP synthase [Methylophilus sp.]|uniref:holo-ACP synthase n=1 Tax=Methylophilus sp. TaxID=29541 RepID=UPI002C5930D9|nr:holo-ACP synthase [Methylophilus sp.]HSH87882.1 holo-ACP synthase [Methylophilus sp.]
MIFGIGTDIVEVERIQASLDQFGEPFARRILAESEWADYQASQLKARFLAKRFAAKEAFAKAIGTGIRGDVSFHNIAVTHDALGRPLLQLAPTLQGFLKQHHIHQSHISISDEKNLALAYVVLETVSGK